MSVSKPVSRSLGCRVFYALARPAQVDQDGIDGSIIEVPGTSSKQIAATVVDAWFWRGGDLLPFDADCTIPEDAEPVY